LRKSQIVRGFRARWIMRRAEAALIAGKCAAAVIRAVKRRRRRRVS